jgi:DMSO/TMAO reductase YedYZ molybdopterin-dependent catalytic subunit
MSDLDRPGGPTVATALLAGLAGVAGSYAAAGYTGSFVVAPLASFLTRTVPDAVLRFAIVTLTDVGRQIGIEHLGQRANLLAAVLLATALFGSLTLAALSLARRFARPAVAVGLALAFVTLAAAVLTGAPVDALGAGLGSGAVVAGSALVSRTGGTDRSDVAGGRRELLGSLASAAGLGVVGYVLGGRQTAGPPQPAVGTSEASGSSTAGSDTDGNGAGASEGDGSGADGDSGPSETQRLLAEAEEKSLDVEGLEGLVSGEDFYEVDTANVNPNLTAEDWTVSVTGAVETERTYDYEEIRSMESELRFMTLRCVSDPLNGKKMDNGLWQGVPIERLLEGTNPQGEYVMLRSSDGYYEEFPVEALRTGLLAYGKDGDVLPRQHGYPARALIPGHWGEINVKWITEIEILDRPAKGFWEERGWHGTGPVHTVAKLHAVDRSDDDGRLTVGGHANAGTRGIERVEVSTDGGERWTEARLSEPLEGTDVWRQWAYTYDPPDGKHEVVVRAVDGTGTLQPKESQDTYPSGATGWVRRTITP